MIAHIEGIAPQFDATTTSADTLRVDLDALEALDTSGAWLIATLMVRLEGQGVPSS